MGYAQSCIIHSTERRKVETDDVSLSEEEKSYLTAGTDISILGQGLDGWKYDIVSEPARVLRVPGTLNHKCKPSRTVEILHDLSHPKCSYPVSAFEEYYGGIAAGLSSSDRALLENHKQLGERFSLPDEIPEGERKPWQGKREMHLQN